MTLINEGDVAALNSGTTNTVLLQELVGLNLRVTVRTNNYAVLSALMQNPAIRLIAVGGSIMDVGKSLYRLYGKALPDADALRRLIEGKGYGRPSARWSGVPATAGTGSEVTCWTSIWDPEKNARRLAVPAPVWVLLMLVCLGMGPKAGVAGLCVHTTAFFTKSFAQSFESIPDETIEALEVTGAGRLKLMFLMLPAASTTGTVTLPYVWMPAPFLRWMALAISSSSPPYTTSSME